MSLRYLRTYLDNLKKEQQNLSLKLKQSTFYTAEVEPLLLKLMDFGILGDPSSARAAADLSYRATLS